MQAFNEQYHEFKAAGSQIIAITGERPEHFGQAAPNLEQLRFPVCFDEGFAVMRQYGIVYELTPALNQLYLDFGLDLALANNTEKPTLVLPAVYVIRQDGRVKSHWLELDHTTRVEVGTVLGAVHQTHLDAQWEAEQKAKEAAEGKGEPAGEAKAEPEAGK